MSTPRRRQIGGSISKVETRSGPRWRFTVDLPPDLVTSKRRQRRYTFSTETEAVTAQAQIRSAIKTRTHVDRSRLDVNTHLDDWLAVRQRDLRPGTWANYFSALNVARDALGNRRLQTIERRDIEALVNDMLKSGGRDGKGRSGGTVALLLTILSRAFASACEEGLIARNPCQYVTPPSRPHHEMATWDADKAARFIDHIEAHPLAGPLHLTMRGLRRGEVLGLTWGDIDLAGRRLHIRRTRSRAGDQVVVGPPKTSRGRRTLPLDPPLVEALARTRRATFIDPVVSPLMDPSERWLAVDPLGEPMRPDAYSGIFLDLAAEAGLPRIRLHDARHTALSLMLERGVPTHVVARFAGHDPAVTMRTYAHVTERGLDEASAVFGDLFGRR